MAHSMGNIVVSEALRRHVTSGEGTLVSSYVASQASSVAMAYDRLGPQRISTGSIPEVYGAYPPHSGNGPSSRHYFNDIKSAVEGSKVVNFYNERTKAF